MKVAIMQPYFFPYLGYFNLIAASDAFISLDNVQYISKGWINRNRIMQANGIYTFTVPLASAPRNTMINQRTVAQDFERFRDKFAQQLTARYRHAPFFDITFELIKEVLGSGEKNLAKLCETSLLAVMRHLGLSRKFYIASQLMSDDESQKVHGKDKLIQLLQSTGGTHYLNLPGGRTLYRKQDFEEHFIKLSFTNPTLPPYRQGEQKFSSGLSIIDVLMFNSPEATLKMTNQYEILN